MARQLLVSTGYRALSASVAASAVLAYSLIKPHLYVLDQGGQPG